mgnify:CR=1 FL=1
MQASLKNGFEFHTYPHSVRHTLIQIDGVPWRHCTVRYVSIIIVEFIKGKIGRWLFFRFDKSSATFVVSVGSAVVVFSSPNDELFD